MGVEVEEDLKRKMIDLCLAEAQKRKSKETGYIHLHYLSKESRDTIPLLENFCFVLALFRSRNTEHIAEGKALLEKLLVFEVDGNFPIYLHEYPICKDRVLGLEILPVLHWLNLEFAFALGELLTHSIQKCLSRIVSHAYKMHSQRPLFPSALFRLKSYFESEFEWTPEQPEEWAHALITSQVCLTHSLLPKALERWDSSLSLYLGEQDQEGQEPKVTLLDLALSHHDSRYSARALKPHPIHLRASLIYPFVSDSITSQQRWWLLSHPQTLHWGSRETLHSLCLEAFSCTTHLQEEGFEWEVALSGPEQKDTIELSLFLNTDAFRSLKVQGSGATTFQLGDLLELSLEGIRCQIRITLESGEGRFFGHFLKGNRSCQRAKGPYLAEDWQIALRTLWRSPECRLKISVKLDQAL